MGIVQTKLGQAATHKTNWWSGLGSTRRQNSTNSRAAMAQIECPKELFLDEAQKFVNGDDLEKPRDWSAKLRWQKQMNS